MGEIIKFLDGSGHMYCFSADILNAVRPHAQIIAKEESGEATFTLNLSSIFIGGSFLEAYLNEQIGLYSHNPSDSLKPNKQFWFTLRDLQKNPGATQKWNLIAALMGGR